MKKTLTTGLLTLTILAGAAGAFAMDANMNGSFETNLRLGAKGVAVSNLQAFLISKEFLTIDSPTGFFGPATRKALIAFQSANNISASGFLGPVTRNFIKSNMGMNSNNNKNNMNDNMNGNMNTSADVGVMVGGAMMIPSRDIVDNAVLANNVTTVVAAVKAAGLVDTLKSKGPFTVFAPTNDAFDKLPNGTVASLLTPEKKADLTSILTYHVVAGRYLASDLKDGMTLKTVNGKDLKITKDASGNIMINGNTKVLIKDIISSNGVTFAIDSVLIPAAN